MPQRGAPPHRSEAGVFDPQAVWPTQSVYSEEPFPRVPPLPQILVWPVPVSETLRRLPGPRQTPRGGAAPAAGGLPVRKPSTAHLFALECSVGAVRGASPQTGVPQGPSLVTGDGRPGLDSGRGPAASWGSGPCAGRVRARACASELCPSSRRHLRRQSPQVGELLLLRGQIPTLFTIKGKDILHVQFLEAETHRSKVNR